MESCRRISSKLTFGLSYHNLAAFFFWNIVDITGASWQKKPSTLNILQNYATMRADRHIVVVVWAEIWAILEKRRFQEKVLPGLVVWQYATKGRIGEF